MVSGNPRPYSTCFHYRPYGRICPKLYLGNYEISLQDKDFWNLHAIFNINTLLKPQMLAYDAYGPERVKDHVIIRIQTHL